MPANTRTKAQRERDLETTAQLYLQGWTQARIAERLGVSRPQIYQDLTKIRKAWMESATADFAEAKARELARVDRIEAEAWAAWEASKVVEQDIGDATVSLPCPGDPRYLAQIERCVALRVKILGLSAPEVTETVLQLKRPLMELSEAELVATRKRGGDELPAG